MKILHIPSAYYPVIGGTELLVRKISEKLALWGHEVIVLTSDVSSVAGYFRLGEKKISRRKDNIGSVEIIRVSFGGLLYKIASRFYKHIPFERLRNKFIFIALSICEWIFAKQIQEQIRRIKPNVIMIAPHLHPNVIATIKARKNNRFPLIFYPCLHEEDTHWSFVNMKTALENVDVVLALTDYEASRLVSRYSVDVNKVITTWIGVDIPNDICKKNCISNKQILFLGRKVIHKGMLLLIEAMKLVWENYPEIKVILAGNREIETTMLDEHLKSLPVVYSKKIESLDNISEEKKASLLESSLCLVLPSKIESFGAVILEAWAYATPVITFDLPVFRSFITPEKDGILVPPDDRKTLAEAIIRIIQNPELSQSLGSAGRKKVKDMFMWDSVVLRYLQACERAIAMVCSKDK